MKVGAGIDGKGSEHRAFRYTTLLLSSTCRHTEVDTHRSFGRQNFCFDRQRESTEGVSTAPSVPNDFQTLNMFTTRRRDSDTALSGGTATTSDTETVEGVRTPRHPLGIISGSSTCRTLEVGLPPQLHHFFERRSPRKLVFSVVEQRRHLPLEFSLRGILAYAPVVTRCFRVFRNPSLPGAWDSLQPFGVEEERGKEAVIDQRKTVDLTDLHVVYPR